LGENVRKLQGNFLTHCMCQSLQNWLAVDKVTAKNKQAYFFWPTLYISLDGELFMK